MAELDYYQLLGVPLPSFHVRFGTPLRSLSPALILLTTSRRGDSPEQNVKKPDIALSGVQTGEQEIIRPCVRQNSSALGSEG